jgi:hypothetical protein
MYAVLFIFFPPLFFFLFFFAESRPLFLFRRGSMSPSKSS